MSERKFKRGDIVRLLGQKVPMTVARYDSEGNIVTVWFGADLRVAVERWDDELLEIIPYPDQPYRDV